jgi:polyhydroxyalkanoate synthesis regulator protein
MARTIKKYANRRLYDTEASRHVTLEGIRQLVASGEDVAVVDDTTGQDITRSILLQVIAFYGNPMQELMAGYLERSVQIFTSQQQVLQDQIQKTLGMTPMGMPPMGGFQNLAARNLEAWNQMQKSFLEMLTPRNPDQSPGGSDENAKKK